MPIVIPPAAGAKASTAFLQVILSDAGQGDCILVVYPDKSLMLIDCGSTKSSAVVRPQIEDMIEWYLPLSGPKHIATLVLTHPDIDHYNLLLKVTNNLNLSFGEVFYGGNLGDYGGGVNTWLAGQNATGFGSLSYDTADRPSFSRAGVTGRILAASAVLAGGKPIAAMTPAAFKNGCSISIVLEYGGTKIYLMGDATDQTEDAIVRSPNLPYIQWVKNRGSMLKVAHHGSKHSSTQAFIETIMPQVLFVSADMRRFNGTGLPNSTTLDDIATWTKTKNGGADFIAPSAAHAYVVFDDTARDFREVSTSSCVFTTLLQYQAGVGGAPDQVTGGSLYYTLGDQGDVEIHNTGT